VVTNLPKVQGSEKRGMKCSEVKWSEVKWSEVKWSEVKWWSWGTCILSWFIVLFAARRFWTVRYLVIICFSFLFHNWSNYAFKILFMFVSCVVVLFYILCILIFVFFLLFCVMFPSLADCFLFLYNSTYPRLLVKTDCSK
jgi:hypothetical protein